MTTENELKVLSSNSDEGVKINLKQTNH